MQESKLKIDFNQGLLEVEGSEDLVREIYNDFKDSLKARPQAKMEEGINPPEKAAVTSSQPPSKRTASKPKSKAKTKKSSDSTGSFLKDLNLMGDDTTKSLRDFYGQYEIKTNLERTLAFVYYLQYEKELAGININHIFTCYRGIDGLKVPGNLKQNLLDTSFKKGWLDTSDMEDIKVPVSGMNHIEHDLSKNQGDDS